jgi:hypothetical protein
LGGGEPGSGWAYQEVFLYILHCQIQKRHQKQMDKLIFYSKNAESTVSLKNTVKYIILGVL